MYNEYVNGITSESVGMVFDGEMTELDFYHNISKGMNYLIRVDEQGIPILVCTHRVVSIGGKRIVLGDYFWIRPENRGNGPFIQESHELLKAHTSSEISIIISPPEYVEMYKFLVGATDLSDGVYLV